MIAPPIPPRVRRPCPRRYPTGMDMEHERTLFTTAEATTLLTTAEAATQLGISRNAVQNAIRRGTLAHVAINPRLNMVTVAGIEAYRRAHLGQVGRPPRKKRRKRTPVDAAATEHHTVDEGGAIHPPEEYDDGHDPRHP